MDQFHFKSLCFELHSNRINSSIAKITHTHNRFLILGAGYDMWRYSLSFWTFHHHLRTNCINWHAQLSFVANLKRNSHWLGQYIYKGTSQSWHMQVKDQLFWANRPIFAQYPSKTTSTSLLWSSMILTSWAVAPIRLFHPVPKPGI